MLRKYNEATFLLFRNITCFFAQLLAKSPLYASKVILPAVGTPEGACPFGNNNFHLPLIREGGQGFTQKRSP